MGTHVELEIARRVDSGRLLDPKILHVLPRPITRQENRPTFLERNVAPTYLPAHARLQLILYAGRPAARYWLRPQVARVARVAANAQRHEMIFVVIMRTAREIQLVHLVCLESIGIRRWRADSLRVARNADGLRDVVLRDLRIDRAGGTLVVGGVWLFAPNREGGRAQGGRAILEAVSYFP